MIAYAAERRSCRWPLATVMQTLVKIGALDTPPRLDDLYTTRFAPVPRP